ncbi:MAG: enoyl-CoA hydratase [Chloroflexi bacterium]|nr:MAG: enoyl-CoA hydratase [Chloroflexota bacterium]MBL1192859.1 enoyl-CoA hydratase [Chloroflexota bacterium]NOH10152.1 enoyl-CoA hydratase [Chloroflexota bacterium]
MSQDALVLTETHDRVGLVRINNPKALNALNNPLMTALMDALEAFDADDKIRAMVVTGNERAFAAGADIKEMVDETPESMNAKAHIAPFDRIMDIQKPVIAAVSGWCLGGGNELAMSCDMLVASETAQFGQPEINLGVIPGAGGTQRLTRAVGKVIAMEMVLNNRTLSAEEALHYGLANRVVPVERYLEEALELAQQIAVRAPVALRTGKAAVNQAFDTYLKDGIQAERDAFYGLFATEDQKEGMQAFAEKRPANWKGA